MVKKGLGRGLDSLFTDSASPAGEASGVTMLRLSFIEPNRDQPRKSFDKEALSELADSIASHGVLQPIIVRALPDGNYRIIAGERRWRASKMAGLDAIPAVIRETGEKDAAQIALVENLQREDLNPVEEAQGYRRLAEEYGMTQDEISKVVSKSRPMVANSMRLLGLSDEILEHIREGSLSGGHGRAILAYSSDPAEQRAFAERIIKYKLPVREAERLAQNVKASSPAPPPPDDPNEAAYYASLVARISDILGLKVNISRAGAPGSGKGRLELTYGSVTQLEELIRLLCGERAFEE